MVLRLKAWESRSLPGFLSIIYKLILTVISNSAGWSSPVARQAHNLKVAGSNPAPATKTIENTHIAVRLDGVFFSGLFVAWL